MTQYQVRPGFRVVDGLPASETPWKMRAIGHKTIIAISEGHGAYLIADGKAEPIRFEQAVLDAHAQFGGDLAEMQVRYAFHEETKSIPFTVAEDHTKW